MDSLGAEEKWSLLWCFRDTLGPSNQLQSFVSNPVCLPIRERAIVE